MAACSVHRLVTASTYPPGMRRHTTIDIDMDLVREAGVALGTTRLTETVHAALEGVVRRRRPLTLLEFRSALDLDDLRATTGACGFGTCRARRAWALDHAAGDIPGGATIPAARHSRRRDH